MTRDLHIEECEIPPAERAKAQPMTREEIAEMLTPCSDAHCILALMPARA